MNSRDISFYDNGLRSVLKNSNKNNSKFNIEIIDKKNNSNIIYIISSHAENINTKNHCISFRLNNIEKYIYVSTLEKCSLSGTEILVILKKIAKIFEVREICLTDASAITIRSKTNKEYILSLRNMYILSTGISWYNNYGYVSKNFEEEKEYNKTIMEIPLLDYMSVILKKSLCAAL